jgi:hypothetical protein
MVVPADREDRARVSIFICHSGLGLRIVVDAEVFNLLVRATHGESACIVVTEEG